MGFQFEWDPAKAASNLEKHGLSFEAASDVFFDPDCVEVATIRAGDGEERRKAFGTVDGKFIAVVFVSRGRVRRIISARRARRKELGGDHRSLHA